MTTTSATYEKFDSTAAENYERWFVPVIPAPLAGDLLDLAAVQPGERLLDVCCGTGIVARAAAQRVGPTGTVAGADVAPDMIAHARSLSTANGTPIDWHEAKAEGLPFDDGSFDVVVSQLGLMFVEDKAAALAEIRRVLAPGGRVAIDVAGAIQPLNVALDDALARHINPDLAGFVGIIFSMHDPAVLERLLVEAGFSDVRAWASDKTFRLPAPADFMWQYINATPMAGFVAPAPAEAKAALEAECVERWQPYVDGDGMVLDQPIVWATATA